MKIEATISANPKTARLVRLAGTGANIRLSAADRGFLSDLARVQIISSDLADKHHYDHLKGGSAGSLERLEKAGLITSKTLNQSGSLPIKTYQFASEPIARAYGGRLPVTGAKRTDLHELMTTRAFYALDRPADFRLAADLTKTEIARCGSLRPDAVYTDPASGEMVMVEADSGQYTQSQIKDKMARWRASGNTRQVWAQPARGVSANVPALPGVSVMKL